VRLDLLLGGEQVVTVKIDADRTRRIDLVSKTGLIKGYGNY
jgi:hypothetical protein